MASEFGDRLAPLEHQTAPLRHKIISALRDAIETGVLEPGTRVVERDLCEQLTVSRTSLREALRELAVAGLLANAEGRGLIVAMPTRDEAENVYRIRATLEALVVEQFIARASDAERRQIAIDGRLLKEAYATGSVKCILAAQHAFNDRLCTGARNAMALGVISELVLRTSSLRGRSLARRERQFQGMAEIDAILAAIRDRDVPAAQAAVLRHTGNAAISAFKALEDDAPADPPAASRPAPRRRRTMAPLVAQSA
jgi:DNA-binding GntR family transcriptional regulator